MPEEMRSRVVLDGCMNRCVIVKVDGYLNRCVTVKVDGREW